MAEEINESAKSACGHRLTELIDKDVKLPVLYFLVILRNFSNITSHFTNFTVLKNLKLCIMVFTFSERRVSSSGVQL